MQAPRKIDVEPKITPPLKFANVIFIIDPMVPEVDSIEREIKIREILPRPMKIVLRPILLHQ